MSEKPSFFSELRRRNVYKVAVAYIVGGWALSQGIAQVFPVFDVPNWAIRLVVLLIIIGLPVALVLAWAFEITPQGIKRTETADAMLQAGRQKNNAWIYVVVVGAVVSIGLFFLGRYTAGNPASRNSEAATALPQKSIAVLPLLNESGDPKDEYFSDGKLYEADTAARKAAELQPTGAGTHRFQVLIAAQRGDGEAALREAQLEPDPGFRRFELAVAHYIRGDRAAADAALADLIANAAREGFAYQIAEVYALRGEKDKAFEWLQTAFDDRDAGMLGLSADPLLRGLRDDPRYKNLVAKVGLPTTP